MQLTASRCSNVKISTLKQKTNNHNFLITRTQRTLRNLFQFAYACALRTIINSGYDVIWMPHLHLTWTRSPTLESCATKLPHLLFARRSTMRLPFFGYILYTLSISISAKSNLAVCRYDRLTSYGQLKSCMVRIKFSKDETNESFKNEIRLIYQILSYVS